MLVPPPWAGPPGVVFPPVHPSCRPLLALAGQDGIGLSRWIPEAGVKSLPGDSEDETSSTLSAAAQAV